MLLLFYIYALKMSNRLTNYTAIADIKADDIFRILSTKPNNMKFRVSTILNFFNLSLKETKVGLLMVYRSGIIKPCGFGSTRCIFYLRAFKRIGK